MMHKALTFADILAEERQITEVNHCHGKGRGHPCTGGGSYVDRENKAFQDRQSTQYGGHAKTLPSPDLSWTKHVRDNFAGAQNQTMKWQGSGMRPATEQAYRAYRKAADRGYGEVKVDTPGRMAKVDARIRRLKARYEAMLAKDKYDRVGWP